MLQVWVGEENKKNQDPFSRSQKSFSLLLFNMSKSGHPRKFISPKCSKFGKPRKFMSSKFLYRALEQEPEKMDIWVRRVDTTQY